MHISTSQMALKLTQPHKIYKLALMYPLDGNWMFFCVQIQTIFEEVET